MVPSDESDKQGLYRHFLFFWSGRESAGGELGGVPPQWSSTQRRAMKGAPANPLIGPSFRAHSQPRPHLLGVGGNPKSGGGEGLSLPCAAKASKVHSGSEKGMKRKKKAVPRRCRARGQCTLWMPQWEQGRGCGWGKGGSSWGLCGHCCGPGVEMGAWRSFLWAMGSARAQEPSSHPAGPSVTLTVPPRA